MSFIKKIRIQNFRNLEDVEIEVKPLTLLFGPNGSGKSSFLKALMFLSRNLFPLNTGKTIYKISDKVDLGSYVDIVIKNDVRKLITFEIDIIGEFFFPKLKNLKDSNFRNKLISGLKNNKPNETFDLTFSAVFQDSEYNYNLSSIYIQDNINNNLYGFYQNETALTLTEFDLEILGIKYWNTDWTNEGVRSIDLDDLDNTGISKEYFIFNNNESISKLFNIYFGRIDGEYDRRYETIFKPDFNFREFVLNFPIKDIYKERFNRYNDEIISDDWEKLSDLEKRNFFYEALKFSYLSNVIVPQCLEEFFDIKHLPLIRDVPSKKYIHFNGVFDENEYHGLLNKIFSKNKINLSFKKIPKEKTPLEILGFNYRYKYHSNEDIGSILLKNEKEEINLRDCSSGIIQITPILISCKYFNILYIEQPELHLHPKLQSRLAFVFKKYITPKTFFLIETHSEHLIRKFQVLIANGEMDRDKLSVLYFNNKNGSTKVEKMEIDEKGLFKKDWPDGFFDDSVNLTMELFEALRKHKN